jgi:Tol biopolymer transport system component
MAERPGFFYRLALATVIGSGSVIFAAEQFGKDLNTLIFSYLTENRNPSSYYPEFNVNLGEIRNGELVHSKLTSSPLMGEPVMSPNGMHIAFVNTDNEQLYLSDTLANYLIPLTPELDIDSNLVWSPNSEKIAFTVKNGRNSFNTDICIVDIQSHEILELTKYRRGVNFPISFSLDGNSLLYAKSIPGEDREDIYLLNLKDNKSKLIAKQIFGWNYKFVPNKNEISFMERLSTSNSNTDRISILNIDDLSTKFIDVPDMQIDSFSWSTDGSEIAFSAFSMSSSRSHIFIMNPDGENRKQLTFGPVNHKYPKFSNDQKLILFSSFGQSANENYLYSINSDGENLNKLTPNVFDKPGSWINLH